MGNVLLQGEQIKNMRYARDPNSLQNQLLAAKLADVQNGGGGNPTSNMRDIEFLRQMKEKGYPEAEIRLMEDAISKRWYGDVGGAPGSAQGGQFTQMISPQDQAAADAYSEYMKSQGQLQSEQGVNMDGGFDLGGGPVSKADIASSVKTAEKDAEYEAKLREQLPQARLNFRSARDNMHNVKTIANKAKTLATKWNTGLMAATNITPGTEGYQLKQELLSLQANAVLGAVAELKQAGGTLGQITEKELPLLESKWARLIASQSPEDLRQNIDQYLTQLERSVTRIGIAGRETYGEDWDLKIDAPTAIQGATQDGAVNWSDL